MATDARGRSCKPEERQAVNFCFLGALTRAGVSYYNQAISADEAHHGMILSEQSHRKEMFAFLDLLIERAKAREVVAKPLTYRETIEAIVADPFRKAIGPRDLVVRRHPNQEAMIRHLATRRPIVRHNFHFDLEV